MVLVPDMFENTSVGVIVDEVRSVLTIDESSVDTNIKGVDENLSDYVQGIIKLGEDDLLKTRSQRVMRQKRGLSSG